MSQDLIGGNQMATTEKGYGEEWAKKVYDENAAVRSFSGVEVQL